MKSNNKASLNERRAKGGDRSNYANPDDDGDLSDSPTEEEIVNILIYRLKIFR